MGRSQASSRRPCVARTEPRHMRAGTAVLRVAARRLLCCESLRSPARYLQAGPRRLRLTRTRLALDTHVQVSGTFPLRLESSPLPAGGRGAKKAAAARRPLHEFEFSATHRGRCSSPASAAPLASLGIISASCVVGIDSRCSRPSLGGPQEPRSRLSPRGPRGSHFSLILLASQNVWHLN